MYVFLPASATLKSWCYISCWIVNNILIQNKTLTRNYSVAFQIFLFHLQRPVCARLLLVWMFSMCFMYNSVYFSPQESATLEPKCTVKVDEYGFFINWQSAERVSSSSLYKKVVRSWCIIYQLVSSFINVTKKKACFFRSFAFN